MKCFGYRYSVALKKRPALIIMFITSCSSVSMSLAQTDPLRLSRAFLPNSSSFLLMTKYRGDSGTNGNKMICNNAGMPLSPSNAGHPDSVPSAIFSPNT